ncbi:hypothetical protein KHA80_03675 [Anaerobacillus sp. HL2]|nr:hypothetical protein KHA80_03675 [Anaerobacillus sp. HL2]
MKQQKRNKEKLKENELNLKDSIYRNDITAQKDVKLDFSNISREKL